MLYLKQNKMKIKTNPENKNETKGNSNIPTILNEQA